MLGNNKFKILLDLINSSTKDELIWMNGYFNGIVKSKLGADETPEASPVATKKITIVYGTETGNSKKLATHFAASAKKKSIHAKVVGMDQYRMDDLQKEEILLAVVSTHGEGEPPVAAKKFYDHIHNNGFKLNKLKYSVLALGDTSYPLYCKTGEDVDDQLNKLGAERLVPMQKCDVEYDDDANFWFNNVLQNLSTTVSLVPAILAPAIALPKKGKQIYTGKVITSINLNDIGSNKCTYHIEMQADDIQYQCGDSIGIVPSNPAAEVEEILKTVDIDRNKKVVFKNEEVSIYDLLKNKINIIHLTERLVKQYAEAVQQQIPVTKMNLLDLLKIYPVKNTVQFEEIICKLNAISPRLYTIASSPSAHAGEVHIVVVKDEYTINNETKFGLCSNYLSGLSKNSEQQFFVQANKRFRLPANDKDIIMVGPGTGIAPFRSFLAERDATGATGKNWLFFGEQKFATDFLYQTEIQNWFETGVLTKVNLAFSRDQTEKIYVQHKMLQHASALYQWLQDGASFFICGKKDRMSIDVEETLITIIEQQGKKTTEQAKLYLEQLEQQGRYEKDVY